MGRTKYEYGYTDSTGYGIYLKGTNLLVESFGPYEDKCIVRLEELNK